MKGLKEQFKFYDHFLSDTVKFVKDEIGLYPYNFDSIDFKEGDIVIDIGGNIGMISIYLMKRFPFLKIFAFEPVKTNYKNFKRNLRLNNIPKNKVIVHNLGVTSDSRNIYMKFKETNTGASRAIYKNITKNKRQKIIKTITLDQIFEKYNITKCKLLKVDCEGCEFEVIYSTKIYNLEKCDNLRMEVHDNKRSTEQINYINKYIKSIQYVRT